MAGMLDRYDTALIGILQNEGQVAKFLEVIYGFLYRKTDFYVIMKDKTAKMGFPEGTALKLAVGAFRKYEQLAARREGQRQKQAEAVSIKAAQDKERENEMQAQQATAVQHAKETETTESGTSEPGRPDTGSEAKISEVAAAGGKSTAPPQQENPEQNIPVNNDANAASAPTPVAVRATAATSVEPKPKRSKPLSKPSGEKSNDDDDDPELTTQQRQFQMKPESYNGAARDKYAWSQSINDVDVEVKVPRWVRKGTDVRVEINKKHLKACHKDETGNMLTVVDEDLTWDINMEESMWSLVPGEHIHVNLEKVQERWWEGLLNSEPKISIRKIDPSRSMTDLDQEAQAKIEEMMFNEHQKRLGKPQSHEQKVHDMLKNAWDVDGSPFKGQAFDPSLVNIQNPGDFNMAGGGNPRAGPPQ